MSRLFKTKNFLIIESIFIFLIIIGYFSTGNAFGDFGVCYTSTSRGTDEIMKCSAPTECISVPHTSTCSEYYGMYLLLIAASVFIIYFAIFAIYKLIKLLKVDKNIKEEIFN